MSGYDLAPDPTRGLEVNQPAPAPAERPGASPERERDDAGSDRDDRSAKNRASEALKHARRAEERLSQLENQLLESQRFNQQLMERLVGNGTQNQAAATPPHGAETLTTLLAEGRHEEWQRAMAENLDWQRRADREEILRETEGVIQKHAKGQALQTFLMRNLGLGTSTETNSIIDSTAKDILKQFPELDQATATVIASSMVYRKAATGEEELPDLRQESLERTGRARGAATGTEGAPEHHKIDWDAPNRGLPPEVAERFAHFGLGKVLAKGATPAEEARFRSVVEDIMPKLEATARKRRLGLV